MKVKVRLYAGLPAKLASRGGEAGAPGAGSQIELELPGPSPLSVLLSRLRLEPEEVLSAFVNGRSRPLDHVLEPGDEVGLFPPVGGG